MQPPEKTLHGAPCNALQRFLKRGLGKAPAAKGKARTSRNGMAAAPYCVVIPASTVNSAPLT